MTSPVKRTAVLVSDFLCQKQCFQVGEMFARGFGENTSFWMVHMFMSIFSFWSLNFLLFMPMYSNLGYSLSVLIMATFLFMIIICIKGGKNKPKNSLFSYHGSTRTENKMGFSKCPIHPHL